MTASSGLDPETITTAIQLDALPVGSVVRSGDGQIWQRVYCKWDCLSENGEGGTYESETVIWQTRPPVATLLYRPDRPSEAARLRSGIEALADEWEAEVGKVGRDLSPWDGGYEAAMEAAAARLRALLSADDEAVE